MEIFPIKTRRFMPPQDDVLSELATALKSLREGDLVAISSKVVSISEGNCVPAAGTDKAALIRKEAEFLIPRDYWPSPLSVKHNAFIGTAGIDASNAAEHYILLPKDPFASAVHIRTFLQQTFQLKNIGVIITDSHSTPMRRGAMGVSIGYAGFAPTKNLVGEADLFGRAFKVEVANIADSVAAAANVVMGEGSESQPVAIVRGVPGIEYTETIDKDYHMVPYQEDTFRVLYQSFLDGDK